MLPSLDTIAERLAGRAANLARTVRPDARRWTTGGDDGRLTATAEFGADPGSLRMLSFVPDGLPAGAPLVVVLHGCTQTAAGYDRGAGWSTLAERYGFAVLFPEQRRANNANVCFNWFEPADTARGHGEVASVCAMVEHALAVHALDRSRVFVTGLSAGGAMAGALLATYPDVFAAGAIVAGLPYGTARGTQQALDRMRHADPRPAPALADLVLGASPHRGPWPRVAVWHGTADTTVEPGNARASVAQWRAVHGLADAPARRDTIDGVPRATWRDARGRVVVEQYAVPGMGHGTPIGPGVADPDQRCGAAAPFLLDVGISSSFRIAEFFGITGSVRRAAAAEPPRRPPSDGERSATIDPARVVRDALRAAGLLKRG